MPMVHMVCGPLGAGKTTLARQLAREQGALRFSLDEWVMQLFGSEAPHPMKHEWWVERCRRCSERVWSVCQELLARDLDVVLDFGFPSVAQRAESLRLAAQFGASAHLHVVTAAAELRWQRVQARNRDRPATYALPVTPDMFRGSETWWELPTAVEGALQITFHPAASPSSAP